MQPHGQMLKYYAEQKKPDTQQDILYDFLMFWKRQNYKDQKQWLPQ